MNEPVTVAAAQVAPVFLDREATVAKACRLISEAASAGARLVVFPETYVPGYPYWSIFLDPTETGALNRKLVEQSVRVPGPATEALCTAAAEAGCFVCIGVNERDGHTLYNTMLLIDGEGRLVGKHRKLVPTNHERMVWGRGDARDLRVYETPLGILGMLICYEHANALFRYALQERHEEIHLACWPGGMPSLGPIIDAAIRHYSFEASCFVVNATAVVTEEIVEALGRRGSAAKFKPAGGQSAIVAPRGRYLAGPVEGVKETVLYARLEPREILDAKLVVDTAGHYARPDVVRLQLGAVARSGRPERSVNRKADGIGEPS